MAYVSAAKGYLVGGYNWGLTATLDTFCYEPEYTWNYEVGLKSTWLDNKLLANLSLFYITIDDKQVSELHPTIAATTITNAAEATSQGFELQLQARLLPGLDIFGGFGYTEAKFDEFNATVWNETGNALTEKDYKGNYLPYAPKYTYNLGMQYRAECGLFARADLLGTGSFYGDAANQAKQNAYTTVNFQLGYEFDSFDFRLWIKNAFDENYLTFISPFQNTIVGIDGPPQTFGFTVSYKF
jgi:iron complex outermembrane receptor protein